MHSYLKKTLACCGWIGATLGLVVACGCSSPSPSTSSSPTPGPSAVAPSSTVEAASPPLLHLAFDGNLTDSGSGQFAVRPVGTVRFAPGRIGQAAVIRAPKAYVEVDLGSHVDLSRGATLEAWFKADAMKAPPGLTTSQALVGFEPLSLALQSSGMVRGFETGTDGKTFFLNSDVRQVSPRQWHHAALVVDIAGTRTVTLYLDGKPRQRNEGVDVPLSSQLKAPLRIGLSDQQAWPFQGLIDDVRLYDRPLTQAEIEVSARRPK